MKLSFRRFSGISLPFVVEPYLDGCPVKVVQFCKFVNNSVRCILAVSRAIFCKCECSEFRQQENFISLREPTLQSPQNPNFRTRAQMMSTFSATILPKWYWKEKLKETDANTGSNTFKEILIHMCATRDKSTLFPNCKPDSKGGFIFLQKDAKIIFFFVAHDKRYEVFLSSGENLTLIFRKPKAQRSSLLVEQT